MGVGKKAVLGGRDVVKVAIVQKAPRFLDKEASLTRAEGYIAEAAAGGSELIVFPEVWLAGYPYWTEGWDSPLQPWVGGRVAFRDAAVLAPSEDTERLGAAARRANAYVVMGCNEIDPRPEVSTIYNSLLFFDPEGRLMGRHRKTMPTFSERMFWGQGDAADLQVFDTDIGRLGGLICGEHVMTLMRAAMIWLGEDIHIAASLAPSRYTLGRNWKSGMPITRRSGAIRRSAPMRLKPARLSFRRAALSTTLTYPTSFRTRAK